MFGMSPLSRKMVEATKRTMRWLARRTSTFATRSMLELLRQVQQSEIAPEHALRLIAEQSKPLAEEPASILQSFARLDHGRSKRTGFPEAVFAEGKTAGQVAAILDDMARNANEAIRVQREDDLASTAIIATRVSPDMFDEINTMTFRYGSIEYHSTARIVSMRASALPKDADYSLEGRRKPRIVVVTAGTSDIPIAEEAAVTLEATKACTVDRVYDAGVAGLHRILQALDRLTHPDVGCIICCAGMDGALPSVVGGLVAVPVVAVPTSIGYGASLGGLCAMMTMMNSCSPGVCVVNIDNGFGAAALALKVIRVGETGHIERND